MKPSLWGSFRHKVTKKFEDFFQLNFKILDSIVQRTLVHGDFHFGNLLFEGDKIVSILDFEWSCAGDPLMDLISHINDMDAKWSESQIGFHKGHGLQGFSENELIRMKVYNMIKNIELCVVAKKFIPEDEAREFVTITETSYLPKD